MNLYDARSYFSQGFEDSLADPAELERQLEAHSMESESILEAIRELAYFATLRRRARELAPRAARTLAADTLLELVAAAGGTISYGRLILEAKRRHKMAGNRTVRVFEALERAGVFVSRFDRADDSVTVAWGEELVPAGPAEEPARVVVELRRPWGQGSEDTTERPFSCRPDESAGLRELHEAGRRELEELRAGRDPRD